jgi:hypothetical protein
MSSSALAATIDAVDFWIPQCYGAAIPSRLDHAGPISSQVEVSNAIDRARKLGKPFYAGLAAYGYTIHFGRDKRRLEVSGSLDPANVASAPSLELVERSRFGPEARGEIQPAGEWQYVYRAKESCVVGELVIREGEWLMLDLPTSEGCGRHLRRSASMLANACWASASFDCPLRAIQRH